MSVNNREKLKEFFKARKAARDSAAATEVTSAPLITAEPIAEYAENTAGTLSVNESEELSASEEFVEEEQEEEETADVPKDLSIIKKLGEGHFAKVFLCKYTGDDQKVKNLCIHGENDQLLIAAKVFKAVPKKDNESDGDYQKRLQEIEKQNEHEANLNEFLNEKKQENPDKARFVTGMGIRENGKLKAILSQFVVYDQKELFSSDLASHLHEKVQNRNFEGRAYKEDIGTTVALFCNGVANAQDDLNNADVLHSDTAARNFLVGPDKSVVIADYGLSQRLMGRDVISPIPNAPLPGRTTDYSTWVDRESSKSSDRFARKATFTGLAGLGLGNRYERDTQLLDSTTINFKETGFPHFVAERFGTKLPDGTKTLANCKDDNLTLSRYDENLRAQLEKCPDPAVKEELGRFAMCYHNYNTRMPDSKIPMQEALAKDNLLLQEANKMYVTTTLAAKEKQTNTLSDIEHTLTTTNQLLALDTGDKTNSQIVKTYKNMLDKIEADIVTNKGTITPENAKALASFKKRIEIPRNHPSTDQETKKQFNALYVEALSLENSELRKSIAATAKGNNLIEPAPSKRQTLRR